MAYEAEGHAVRALTATLARLTEKRGEVSGAREALRVAEVGQAATMKDVGGAVRALRAELGITADQMARMHYVDTADALRQYVNFEDTGEIDAYRLAEITKRLLIRASEVLPTTEGETTDGQ